MYLLDTNICIYAIKNASEKIVTKIKSIQPHEIFISSITVAELEYGVAKSIRKDQNRIAFLKFIAPFDILFFTDSDAVYFGEIRAYLEKKGTIIGAYDLQIASQALSNKFTLVTNNVKEFERIPKLQIENWV